MKTNYDIIPPCSEEIGHVCEEKSQYPACTFLPHSKCYIPEERGIIIVLRMLLEYCRNFDQLSDIRHQTQS